MNVKDASLSPNDLVDKYTKFRDNPTSCAGIYRHHKNGKDYQLISQGINTETNEKVAIYLALYGKFEHFVRPWDMFFEIVEHEGKQVPRFWRMI